MTPQEFYCIPSDGLIRVRFVDQTIINPPYIHTKRKAGEYIVYIIKHGEMRLREDREILTLKPGDFCILDKDRTHEGLKATECDYYYIHFSYPEFRLIQEPGDEIMKRLLHTRQDTLKSNPFSYEKCEDNLLYLPKYWHMPNKADWVKIEVLVQQAIQENYHSLENHKVLCALRIQEAFIEISRSFVTAWQEEYSKQLPGYYTKVQEILEWINKEYAQEITGDLLEVKFGKNFDYMNRIFKKAIGQTIFQYLTKVRINHAKILIINTPMRMGEVGEKVGFPDEYYFNRVFKKHVGVPPAAYAKTKII